MDLNKLDAVTAKMNKITQELTKNVQTSEEILTTADELTEVLEALPPKIQAPVAVVEKIGQVYDMVPVAGEDAKAPTTINVDAMAGEVMNVEAMVQDFNYMRSLLKETTSNSKTVLESVTEELLNSDEDSRAGLILAFSELNKAQLEGIKLFMQSYKEISIILANFAKVQKDSRPKDGPNNVYTTNVLNVEASATSTADIINRLRG